MSGKWLDVHKGRLGWRCTASLCVLMPHSHPPQPSPAQPPELRGWLEGRLNSPASCPHKQASVGVPGARAGAGRWNRGFLSGPDVGRQPRPALQTSPDQVPGGQPGRQACLSAGSQTAGYLWPPPSPRLLHSPPTNGAFSHKTWSFRLCLQPTLGTQQSFLGVDTPRNILIHEFA